MVKTIILIFLELLLHSIFLRLPAFSLHLPIIPPTVLLSHIPKKFLTKPSDMHRYIHLTFFENIARDGHSDYCNKWFSKSSNSCQIKIVKHGGGGSSNGGGGKGKRQWYLWQRWRLWIVLEPMTIKMVRKWRSNLYNKTCY